MKNALPYPAMPWWPSYSPGQLTLMLLAAEGAVKHLWDGQYPDAASREQWTGLCKAIYVSANIQSISTVTSAQPLCSIIEKALGTNNCWYREWLEDQGVKTSTLTACEVQQGRHAWLQQIINDLKGMLDAKQG